MQYELVQEALETQKDKLDILENAEKEARRLDEALERGMASSVSGSVSGSGAQTDEQRIVERERERAAERERERERGSRRGKGSGFGGGLLSAVKYSLSGMMDVDPEATRRANIAKTRDNISQVGIRMGWGTDEVGGLAASLGSGSQVCVDDAAGGSGQVPETKGRRSEEYGDTVE